MLIHYGSYETTFLKAMKERHGEPPDESVSAKAIGAAINLVSAVFARIYFPTFSNGLKEIACYLGFNWSVALASGVQTIVWRETWLSRGEAPNRQKLIFYNADDCAALGLVTLRILSLNQARSDSRGAGDRDVVDTAALKREYLHGFKRNTFFFPELDAINKAAYWDYQREKVYVKSSRRLHHALKTTGRSVKSLPPNKHIQCPLPTECPACSSQRIHKNTKAEKIVHDLKFTRFGLKRWIVHYHFHRYMCRGCGKGFYPKARVWSGSKFGPSILTYSVYQNIELRLPQETIDKSLNKLFGLRLAIGTASNLKMEAAQFYAPAYESLLKKLQTGCLLHADETKAGVRHEGGYVWAFASLEEVAYVYTESRESDWTLKFLKDFKGVLYRCA